MSLNVEVEEIRVIELKMMDKRKYYPLTVVSGFTIRGFLFPFSLIKTRLQIQKGTMVYKGTFDAFLKITKYEGMAGLYRGFWVSCLQIFPSFAYITTYENTRHYLLEQTSITNSRFRAMIAGATASVVGQTLAVPVDIVSQHMMLLGQRKGVPPPKVEKKLETMQRFHIPDEVKHKRFGAVAAIVREVYRVDGFLGFYKGYFVSLSVFAPNSALWWFFYDTYSEFLSSVYPEWVPRLAMQCTAAPLGGISAAVITNPLDLIRARMQVDGTPFKKTVDILWREEHLRILTKGLSARLMQSVTFSFFIILGYETIKRWSLLEEYKDAVRW